MIPIHGIHHIGIRVAELARSRTFYAQFGFQFIAGPIGPEPVAVMHHPSGIHLNLILNANSSRSDNILLDCAEKYAGYTHMALDTSDLDAVAAMLHQLQITITEGPITLPDGGRMLFIRDPDANVIEFHQSPPADTDA